MAFYCNGKKGVCDCDILCADCKFCDDTGGKNVQTNADRIRAMSDEELVEFLGEYQFADMCDEGCEACTYHGDCNKRLLNWLKQPAEVTDNEKAY